jgi:hypothetical protein
LPFGDGTCGSYSVSIAGDHLLLSQGFAPIGQDDIVGCPGCFVTPNTWQKFPDISRTTHPNEFEKYNTTFL